MRWARFAYDELKREQRVTQMPAGGSPSLPCYRMDSSDRAGYPSAATDPQRPARVIVFSAEERGGVCKRREPSLRRGWDRAAPQSRRRSFQGHGAYRAHRFGLAPTTSSRFWGPAARRFFDECLDAAHTDRDIDFYHWSSQSFGDFWKDALSVLMARERARIGLAASKGDWPRRIAEYARDDQEDAAAYAANY